MWSRRELATVVSERWTRREPGQVWSKSRHLPFLPWCVLWTADDEQLKGKAQRHKICLAHKR